MRLHKIIVPLLLIGFCTTSLSPEVIISTGGLPTILAVKATIPQSLLLRADEVIQ